MGAAELWWGPVTSFSAQSWSVTGSDSDFINGWRLDHMVKVRPDQFSVGTIKRFGAAVRLQVGIHPAVALVVEPGFTARGWAWQSQTKSSVIFTNTSRVSQAVPFTETTTNEVSSRFIELPFLLKIRMGHGRYSPYVLGGVAVMFLTSSSQSFRRMATSDPINAVYTIYGVNRNNSSIDTDPTPRLNGTVFDLRGGLGVERRVGKATVLLEVRVGRGVTTTEVESRTRLATAHDATRFEFRLGGLFNLSRQ